MSIPDLIKRLDLETLAKRLKRRLQIRYGTQDKVGIVHAMVDYDDLRAAIDAVEALAILRAIESKSNG